MIEIDQPPATGQKMVLILLLLAAGLTLYAAFSIPTPSLPVLVLLVVLLMGIAAAAALVLSRILREDHRHDPTAQAPA